MKPNIGAVDRALRIILGLDVIAWGFINHNWLCDVGAVFVLTALVRFCPLYCLLGINTCGEGGNDGGCCGGGKCG